MQEQPAEVRVPCEIMLPTEPPMMAAHIFKVVSG